MKTPYKVGDKIRGCDVYRFGDTAWMHIYEILDIESAPRFGKPDFLYTVKIVTTNGHVVDQKTKRWSGQLF